MLTGYCITLDRKCEGYFEWCLVYGFNPNHNYLIRRPPALEKVINNEILANSLNNAFLRYCSLNTRPKLMIVSVVKGNWETRTCRPIANIVFWFKKKTKTPYEKIVQTNVSGKINLRAQNKDRRHETSSKTYQKFILNTQKNNYTY